MASKLTNSLILSFATGMVIAISVQACKVNKATAALPDRWTPKLVRIAPLPKVVIPKKDTVRHRTQQEIREYLREQYQLNYNQFFAPEFRKLSDIINKQADMITEMRVQAMMHNDSISAMNSKYISAALESATLANRYQRETIEAKKEAVASRKEYDIKIQDQINSNNKQAVIYITGVVVLFCIVCSLFLYCRSRFKSIEKRLSYV